MMVMVMMLWMPRLVHPPMGVLHDAECKLHRFMERVADQNAREMNSSGYDDSSAHHFLAIDYMEDTE